MTRRYFDAGQRQVGTGHRLRSHRRVAQHENAKGGYRWTRRADERPSAADGGERVQRKSPLASMQTDGDSPVTVVEADGEPPATVVEVLAVEEELTPAGIVEELAPAVAVDVLGSSEAVSAATSDACVCSECNKVHPQSNFSRNQWRKPVEQRRCKACVEESLPKPKPSKVEVQRMAREEEARRKLEDSQHCQELESGCYSVPPPCCCLVCFWLQFDESKTRFILGPGNQMHLPLALSLLYLQVRSETGRCCAEFSAGVFRWPVRRRLLRHCL